MEEEEHSLPPTVTEAIGNYMSVLRKHEDKAAKITGEIEAQNKFKTLQININYDANQLEQKSRSLAANTRGDKKGEEKVKCLRLNELKQIVTQLKEQHSEAINKLIELEAILEKEALVSLREDDEESVEIDIDQKRLRIAFREEVVAKAGEEDEEEEDDDEEEEEEPLVAPEDEFYPSDLVEPVYGELKRKGTIDEYNVLLEPDHALPLSVVSLPKYTKEYKRFSSSIKCKGCHKEFPCRSNSERTFPSSEYYNHCIEGCDAYKALGLIRTCLDCNLKFINGSSLGLHNRYKHPYENKPFWMTTELFKRILRRKTPDMKGCQGCGKELPVCSEGNSSVRLSLQYYVHCIEECEAYKSLGLIQECSRCQCKFINRKSYACHQKICANK